MKSAICKRYTFSVSLEDIYTNESQSSVAGIRVLNELMVIGPEMLAKQQPHSTSRFAMNGKLGVLDEATGNDASMRKIPAEMNILAIFE